MKTKAFVEDFKGNTIFAVWEVDDAGDKVGRAPIFSMGIKKARALVAHISELQDFVSTDGAATTPLVDLGLDDGLFS